MNDVDGITEQCPLTMEEEEVKVGDGVFWCWLTTVGGCVWI